MTSSKLIKWTVAAAAAGMLSIAAVPALAAHGSHKSLSGATTRPSHTATLSAAHKAHRLVTKHTAKAKLLASSSGKHVIKSHHRKAISSAAAHKHSAKSLDKSSKKLSNM